MTKEDSWIFVCKWIIDNEWIMMATNYPKLDLVWKITKYVYLYEDLKCTSMQTNFL